MGGRTYNDGLFRIYTFEDVIFWTEKMRNYFEEELSPEFIFFFASNWQGCMYCINLKNNVIIYFDPATREFFKSEDTSLDDFLDSILVDGEYDIIFEEYYYEAKAFLRFKALKNDESVGHKIYLQLGTARESRLFFSYNNLK